MAPYSPSKPGRRSTWPIRRRRTPSATQGARFPLQVLYGDVPQDSEFRPQRLQQALILFQGLFPGGGAAGGGRQDLRQGASLKGLGALRPEARRAVGQLLHPVLHPDGQLFFAADRTQAAPAPPSRRRQAHTAVPVSVQMVFALLREELHRAQKALTGAEGVDQLRIGEAGVQQVGLPAQPGGGWASEWDRRLSRSSADTRQFMGGSEESPVSTP